MNQFNYYRIFLTPLSPAHIGTGDSYEPTDYVIEDGTLYEFDTGTAMGALGQDDRAELARITEGRPGPGMIQGVQQFFYNRRFRLLPAAVNRILVSDGVAQLYAERIGKIAQREGKGKQIVNVLEIGRTAYNPVSRQPTLVGSSLKGAIRTALLDDVNKGRRTTQRDGLHKFQGSQNLFRYNQNRLQLHRDPMRLVHVSDASWHADDNSPTAEVFFAANLKKVPAAGQQGKKRSTTAESGPPQILECIPCFYYRAFAAQLNIQMVDGINKPGSLPDADLRFDMRRIASACNAFYGPILEDEMRILSANGYLETAWSDAIKTILEDSRLKNGDAFLLRVGRHSGAESVTLRGARKIRIKGRGQRAEDKPSATTVWLAARRRGQTSGLLPFGWLLAECYPLEKAADENLTLKTLCAETARALRARIIESPGERHGAPPAGGNQSFVGRSAPRRSRQATPPSSREQSPGQDVKLTATEEIWDQVTITWNAGGGGVLTAEGKAPGQRATAQGKLAQEIRDKMSDDRRKQLFDRKRPLTNVKVVVEKLGNQKTLKRLVD